MRPGAVPCIATARDFVCHTVLKKRGKPPAAAGAVQDPTQNPAAGAHGERAGSAERGKQAPPLHLFHDEDLNSFFRRLAWSPEGAHARLFAHGQRRQGCVRLMQRVECSTRPASTRGVRGQRLGCKPLLVVSLIPFVCIVLIFLAGGRVAAGGAGRALPGVRGRPGAERGLPLRAR